MTVPAAAQPAAQPAHRPFAAAHRGLSAEQPENTLAAFRAAADAGFPSLEMDLRLTRDGEVVVLHDSGLERTTSGSGRVADMAYDEVRSHPTPAGPVPRLDDVLKEMRGWNGLWNLELKVPDATEPVLHLLEHHHRTHHALISSMDPRSLETARRLVPDLPRALIVLGPPDPEELHLARQAQCGWVNVDHEFLSPAGAHLIRQEGLRMGAWTVNDAVRALDLVAMGVECIITDRREVLQALAGRAEPKPYF